MKITLWHVWRIDETGEHVVACDLVRSEAVDWAAHRERNDPSASYVACKDGDPPPAFATLRSKVRR